jgi:hypothetical protein
LSELSNPIEQHKILSTSHTSTSSHRASYKSASLSQLSLPKPLKDDCEHMSSLDTHTLSSLFLYLFFVSASKEGYVHVDEVEDFDPFENPLDKFHTRIGLLPSMFLVTRILLLLQDLHVHRIQSMKH